MQAKSVATAKVCPHCGKNKEFYAYSKSSKRSDCLQSWCKSCYSNWGKTHPRPIAVIEKLCKQCGLVKPAKEFSRDRAKTDGLRNLCKDHDRELRRQRWNPSVEAAKALCRREENRPKAMLKALRQGAKKRGVSCVLTEKDLAAIPIPSNCPVLGIELKWTRGKRTDHTPSIDRINPRGIYENGNWRYISWKANRLKSNCDDPAVFAALLNDLERLSALND